MLRISPRLGFTLLSALFWIGAVGVMLNQWFSRRAESLDLNSADLGATPDLGQAAMLAAREVWVGFFLFCMAYVATCLIYVTMTWLGHRRRQVGGTQWKVVRATELQGY